MRSIVLVQQGLRDNVRAIIQCDAISCVEIDGLRSESPLTPGEAPLAIVTRKPARGKSVPLPHHLSRLPRLDFDPDDTSKLAANIIDLLSARLKRAEEDAGSARLSASILRRENQSLEENLKSVENFLYTLGNPRAMRALSWDPVGRLITIAPGQSLLQNLPVGAASISAVDIWFPTAPREVLAHLDCRLVCASGQGHTLRATPTLGGIDAGWVRFSLPAPLQVPEQDCALRLSWAGKEPLALGLGNAVPDPAYAAHLEQAEPQDHVLALRIWKSLPGVRLPEATPILGGDLPALTSDAGFLSPSDLPKPELFATPPLVDDHVSASFWENEDAVMVHPSRHGAVCAVIRGVELPALAHLSALVNVGHPRAPSLNFSVGVAPHGAVDEDGYWQRRMGPWVHGLPPQGWSQAHCVPVEPIVGRADILLAVSLASDRANDHSWGLFRGFRITRRNILPLAAE
ncbi:hypothetical protein GL279_11585 [Paracoccus limosus]|uniref:Uncharacterized protein n=1 Tax=Paracoccus limosus TaxID=913252 RepID=A0A844H336_9RHOB|nr:DUF6212 domain-containing protein [Paracoccus limosus]MTH35242.1 hypothetical protein [Paracoccus limosus]